MQKFLRSPIAWILISVVFLIAAMQIMGSVTGFQTVPTSKTIELLQGDAKLKSVVLVDGEQLIQVTDSTGKKTQSAWVGNQVDDVVPLLEKRKAAGTVEEWTGRNPSPGFWQMFLYTGLPFLLMIGLLIWFVRGMSSSGSGGPLSFGKSKAKLVSKDMPKTTFGDVAGADEAVEELEEIKEFLAEHHLHRRDRRRRPPSRRRPGRRSRRARADPQPVAGSDVDLVAIARRTPGFSGADLANVLNEAALLAARQNLEMIRQPQLDEAIDRVIAGPQKRTRVMKDRERLITAYHEGGHALVAAAMPGNDPVQKVTILPRGRALGYTMVMPLDDKYSVTRNELLDQLTYAMGGRVAEELVFHDPTTGAANDIEKATRVARAMVMQYGMSERVGSVKLGGGDSEPFMGMRGTDSSAEFSEAMAAIVDQEVAALIHTAHQEAFDVLKENRDVLDELVRQLFKKETLNRHEVDEVFKPLRRRERRPAWTGSDNRMPSDIPPVEVPPAPEPMPEQPTKLDPPVDGPSPWGPPTAEPSH